MVYGTLSLYGIARAVNLVYLFDASDGARLL